VKTSSRGASALDRVSVYADAYFLRLREILENDFELARVCLGQERFVALIADYLSAKPPFHPDAAWVGSRLPRFVESHAEWRRVEHLAETLALEWAINESLYSPWVDEKAAVQLSELAADDLSRAQFVTDPSVKLVYSPALLEDAWLNRSTSSESGLCDIERDSDRPWLLVRRGAQGEIKFTRFNEGERLLWREIQRAQTLTQTCENLSNWNEAVAALSELGGWAQRGLIKEIRISSSSGNDEDVKKGETQS
jgi:hypothetical protein